MAPRITIITPSYNQAQFLESTIASVLDQRYSNLEYMIVDGASTDGSVEIIRRYEKHLAWWVSEPDRGQAHAINKGIERATGSIVAFINSDDQYLPGAFSSVVEAFAQNPGLDWLCGDTIMFGEGHPTQLVKAVGPRSAAQVLAWENQALQPGMFWKRALVEQRFNEEYRFAFDMDFYVRLLLKRHRCGHLPLPVATYRLHPSSKTVAEGSAMADELDHLAVVYDGHLPWLGRQRCRSTQLVRRSFRASSAGDRSESARQLVRAFLTYPGIVTKRPFWGTLRRSLTSKR